MANYWIRISILFFLFPLSYSEKEFVIEKSKHFLGSYFQIKLFSKNKELGALMIERAFSLVKYYDSLFSYFNPKSELFFINQNGKGALSPEMKEIILDAQRIHYLSHGCFDITIAPLMELWGFYNRRYRIPDSLELRRAKELIGRNSYWLLGDSIILKKGAKIDLGGIACGYIIDKVVSFLQSQGIKKGLVDAGGDIKFWGDWDVKIGIKHPRKEGVYKVLTLRNTAISTSGDYGHYFEVGNKRFSHILDPRTGYPIPSQGAPILCSVTVIGPDAKFCDALATTFFVTGRDGLKILDSLEGYKAILLYEENGTIKEVSN